MAIKFVDLTDLALETIIIPLIKNNGNEEDIPDPLKPYIDRLVDTQDFSGKLGEIKVLYPHDSPLGIIRLILVGLGKTDKITPETIRRAFGSVGNQLRLAKITEVGLLFSALTSKNAESVFEGIFLGNYRYLRYKTSKKDLTPELKDIHLICEDAQKKVIEKAFEYTKPIVQGTFLSRDLGNAPGNFANPAFLAEETLKLQELGLQVTVLDTEAIKEEKMGLFLAVAQGSLDTEPPKFIIAEYNPEKSEKTLVLIGKGITFDTGGISLKSSPGMEAMKYDMCGGAAVIGAMKAIALLKPQLRVIGLIPATPNVPDAKSYRPGDIITSRSEKQIEIVSTDAEGRNLLADTLDYAKKYNPTLVIDFATLTGACVIALGHINAGFYVNDKAEPLTDIIFAAGRKSGDYCWQMPLDQDYFEYLKSTHADFKHGGGRWGGSVTAAMFLKQFTDYPWIHVDIAGTSWKGGNMGGKTRYYNATNGATGFGVRLITEFIRKWETPLE
ncbi:MAG: leucyl aminopeptidase [Candidatus Hodarchaeales archaeon]|jgi:leucyl aminopeptidase